jgi:mRNA interferase MazF
MSKFNRGDVWLVDLGLAAKVRPCLVVSIPATLQDRALVCLVPHTTAVRNSQFDAQNLVTVPHAKMIRRLGDLPDADMQAIEERLKLWLNLD